MSESRSKQATEKLIREAFDRDVGSDERQQLSNAIREDPELRSLYSSVAYVHVLLEEVAASTFAVRRNESNVRDDHRDRSAWPYVAIACLTLAMIIGYGVVNNDRPAEEVAEATTATPDGTEVARVSRVRGAGGDLPDGLQVGDSLITGTPLAVPQGLVELIYTGGERLFVEGPSIITAQSDHHCRIFSGRLVVDRRDGPSGFVVDLPHGQVRDVSTVFAIDVVGDGVAEVHVLEGVVEPGYHDLTSGWSSSGQTPAGLAKRIDPGSDTWDLAEFEAERFTKLESLRLGIRQLEGAVSLRSMLPPSFRPSGAPTPRGLVIVPEKRRFGSRWQLSCDRICDDGEYRLRRPAELGQAKEVGLRTSGLVDTFLLHLDRGSLAEVPTDEKIRGSITFENKIAGVQLSSVLQFDSDVACAVGGVTYPERADRQLAEGSYLVIEDDTNRLRFSLIAGPSTPPVQHLRVFIEAPN